MRQRTIDEGLNHFSEIPRSWSFFEAFVEKREIDVFRQMSFIIKRFLRNLFGIIYFGIIYTKY